MRYLRPIFALLSLLAAALPATAQISIDKVSAPSSGVAFRDTLKSTPVDVDYFSLARYKAERAAIRKERNYLEIGTGLNGTLTSNNESWMKVSGGDNSITLLATLYLRHTFTKNLFSISDCFSVNSIHLWNGWSGNVGIHNTYFITFLTHSGCHGCCDKRFSNTTFTADYADYMLYG